MTPPLQSFISDLLLDDCISRVEIVPDNAKGLTDSFSMLADWFSPLDEEDYGEQSPQQGDCPVRRGPLQQDKQQDKQRAKSESRWETRTTKTNEKELVTPQRFKSPLQPRNSSMKTGNVITREGLELGATFSLSNLIDEAIEKNEAE
jgi:hypothetical protein